MLKYTGLVRPLTDALFRKGLDTDQLGRRLLLGTLLFLPQEWEWKDLTDRIVVGDELEKALLVGDQSHFDVLAILPYHGKTIDTKTPTTGRRH